MLFIILEFILEWLGMDFLCSSSIKINENISQKNTKDILIQTWDYIELKELEELRLNNEIYDWKKRYSFLEEKLNITEAKLNLSNEKLNLAFETINELIKQEDNEKSNDSQ